MKVINMRRTRYLFFSLFLSICMSFISGIKAQNTISFELLDKKVEGLAPAEKVSVYLKVFAELIDRDILKASQYNQKALEISLANNLVYEQACSYFNFGIVDRNQANYSQGIKGFNRSLKLFEQLNDEKGQAQCYNNIGIIYKNTGELKLAMLYYLKALQFAENASYKEGIANATSNIANIFLKQGEYKQAIVYLERSLAIQINKDKQHTILNNLGIAYKAIGNYSKALMYYNKSLDVCKRNKDYKGQASPLSNIGVILLEQHKYEKALVSFREAQKIEEKFNLKKDLITTYTSIGLAYRMLKDFTNALKYLEKAMLLAEKTSAYLELTKVYLSLALTYEEYGKYVLALDYLYRYISLNKELFNLEKNKQVEELLAKFEAVNKEKELILLRKDKKIKEIELKNNLADLEKQKLQQKLETKENENRILLLKKQNELQSLNLQKNEIETEKKKEEIAFLTKESELQKMIFEKRQSELKQKNVLKNIAIISAGFIIISAIILIIVYQQKLRTVELLNLKTEEVSKQKIYELLRDQEFSAIKANIDGQEKERTRIAQDLHDGIGGNLASIKLNLANIIKGNNNEKLKNVMKNIDDTYNEVRSISHNLVPSKIMNEAFINLIRNFISEILDRKLFAVKFIVFPEKELNLLPNELKIELYRIIQELMNNIIKYSKAKNVDIQLIKRNEQVNLMVEDDGVGFDTNSQVSGIGLSNIRSRIKAFNGDINIESSIGNWTLVNIEIPL